jgi:hypothetical protein
VAVRCKLQLDDEQKQQTCNQHQFVEVLSMTATSYKCLVPLHVKRLQLLQALTGVNVWTLQLPRPEGSWKRADPISTSVLFASPDIVKKNGEPVLFYVSISLLLLELCNIPQILLGFSDTHADVSVTDIRQSLMNLHSALGVRMTDAAPSIAAMQAFFIETLGTK